MKHAALDTRLTDALGCRYPIVQTAMGWVADSKLTSSTCNAGGFGFLAAATIEAHDLEAEIRKTIELTDKPFGINFHMFQPNAAQVVDLAIQYRKHIRAVSYGRGPDKATIARFKKADILCMPTVGAVKHATKAVEMGADIVTVQGSEGGGHTGHVASTILLPQVLDAVSVPVVAAGGFFDGRGLIAALAFGASGIAMGTRFLMTSDSPVPPETLKRYVAVKDAGQIRASSALDGLPQRMIDNRFLLDLEQASALKKYWLAVVNALKWKAQTGMSISHIAKVIAQSMGDKESSWSQVLMASNAPVIIQTAMVHGDPDNGVLPSGQAAAAIGELPSCEQLIQSIVKQATLRLDALSGVSEKHNEIAA